MLLCNFSKVTQLESDSVRIQTQDCLTGKLNENTYKHALSTSTSDDNRNQRVKAPPATELW